MKHSPANTQQTSAHPLPVFVYGTLRRGYGNDRLWNTVATDHYDGQARVDGYRLVSNGSFPYMLPTDGRATTGSLIVASPEHYDALLDQMDRLEGVPMHYLRLIVDVTTPDGAVEAWAYVPQDHESYANMHAVQGDDWARATRLRGITDWWDR